MPKALQIRNFRETKLKKQRRIEIGKPVVRYHRTCMQQTPKPDTVDHHRRREASCAAEDKCYRPFWPYGLSVTYTARVATDIHGLIYCPSLGRDTEKSVDPHHPGKASADPRHNTTHWMWITIYSIPTSPQALLFRARRTLITLVCKQF